MFNIAYNGIITVNRGDSFTLPLALNYGTNLDPFRYTLSDMCVVYFAVMNDQVCYTIFDSNDCNLLVK